MLRVLQLSTVLLSILLITALQTAAGYDAT
jgi:hypothetical protein